MQISSSYAKILGETNFRTLEIPQSGSKAKDGEKKERKRPNDGNNNGQAMHGARKPPGPKKTSQKMQGPKVCYLSGLLRPSCNFFLSLFLHLCSLLFSHFRDTQEADLKQEFIESRGGGVARDDFATFEFIMFISVFNVKNKVTVYIYLKLPQPRST